MTITPTTPADKCREYVAECLGHTKVTSDGWYHPSARKIGGIPITTGLDILHHLPPGWDFEVSTFSWWAYRVKDRLSRREAGEQQVPRTDDNASGAARLVALAWQEHKKEAKR